MLDKWRTFLKKNKGNVIFVFGVITISLTIIFLIFHTYAINAIGKLFSYFLLFEVQYVIIFVSASFGVMWNVLRRDLNDIPSAWNSLWLLESWMLFPPLITTSFSLNVIASRNFAEVYRTQSPEMAQVSYPDVAGYSQFVFSAPTLAMWIAGIAVNLLFIVFLISMFKRQMRIKYKKPFYDSNGNLFFGREAPQSHPEFKRFVFIWTWFALGVMNMLVAANIFAISELHAKTINKAELIYDISTNVCAHCGVFRPIDSQRS